MRVRWSAHLMHRFACFRLHSFVFVQICISHDFALFRLCSVHFGRSIENTNERICFATD